MARLLVTRPEPDAGPLIDALRRFGVTGQSCPIMRIKYLSDTPLDTSTAQGLLLTSANGARASAARGIDRTMPVLAVGDATAREAIRLGFKQVESAGGNVDDLATLVRRLCAPENGPLLHAAGTVVAGDLAGDLAQGGFDIVRAHLYEAETLSRLPSDCEWGLKYGLIDGVIVYSPRTARTFEALLKSSGIERFVSDLTLFSLSPAVDEAAELRWAKRVVAPVPTQESLLGRVRTWYY